MSRYVDLEGVSWDGKPIVSKIQEVKTKSGSYMNAITTGWLYCDEVPHIDLDEHDAEIRRQVSEMRWIPVTERLPEEGIDVLTQEIDGNMFVGWYDKICGWFDSEFANLNQVIAWMPLPEPYKK